MTTGGRHDVRRGGPVPPGGDELIELLYGELPPDEERAVRARVAGDANLSAQLAELERVRELVRGLPEEEPPPAISAQLMAAAAQAAPRRAATAPASAPGFWARFRSWFQPVLAHPALAAACSVVLIAGVAGVLMLRQGDKLTQATRSAEPEPEAGTASPDPAAPAPSASGSAAPGGGGPGVLPDVAPAPEEAPAAEQAEPAPPASVATADKTRTSRRPRALRPDDVKDFSRDERLEQDGPADRGGALGINEPKAARPRDDANRERRAGDSAGESVVVEDGEAQGGVEGGSVSPPPAAPPPASAPAPQPSQTANGGDSSSGARDLHEQAIKAAASKRCLQVRSLEQKIRSMDPAYHERAVLRDKRLAVCLSASKPAKARGK